MRREYCAEKRFSVLVDLIVIYFVRHNLRNGDRLRTGGGRGGKSEYSLVFWLVCATRFFKPWPFFRLGVRFSICPRKIPDPKNYFTGKQFITKKVNF